MGDDEEQIPKLITNHVVMRRAVDITKGPAGRGPKIAFLYTLLLFSIRGVVLWVIVPVTFAFWLVLSPIRLVRRLFFRIRHPTFRQYLTWADEVLITVLEHTVLRPLCTPSRFPYWPKVGDRGPKTSLLDLE
jgi:hypothetical protein